jgi:hypothetical protein
LTCSALRNFLSVAGDLLPTRIRIEKVLVDVSFENRQGQYFTQAPKTIEKLAIGRVRL